MISKALQDAINEQIKNELYSAYIYLSMSAHFEAATLPGFARWMRMQSQEEVEHAMRFFDFINDRGGRVVLHAIDKPPVEWSTALQVFEQVLEHEKKVTAMIYRLYELALKENDYPAQVMLQWFITEQVEEEKSAAEVVEHLKMTEGRGSALLYLDKKLGRREAEED